MAVPAAIRCEGSTFCKAMWLQLLFSLPVMSLFYDTCKEVTFNVPPKLQAGDFVGRVNVKRCLNHSGFIRSNNPNFTILEDGSLYTTTDVSLSSNESVITIFLKDVNGHEQKKIHASLLTHPKKTPRTKARHTRETVLLRSKRRWVPVPTTIMENSMGPFPMQIQQLSSDTALKYNIKYSLSGHGVDKPPLNYFYIEKETGNIFVTCPIDREEYPEFQVICYATTPDGYSPEIPLLHIIRIEDDNDNPPVFDHDIYTFHVLENTRIGTLVGQVTATDKDEPYTLHTKVKYRIVSQNFQIYYSSSAFAIHPDSGSITVASHLDRETASEHKLEIEARDMGGQEFGLCTTTEVIIEVGDVNDNTPQLLQTVYEVQIFENTENIELLHIPVRDNDELGTPSWLATFTIIKGNEDKIFSITIDEETNVGVLAALKGLDYEKSKERILEIAVNNKAPYATASSSRGLSTNTATVVIRIRNQDEGPIFEPCEYILHVKECLPIGTVVGNYQARDPDIGNSEGISYRIVNGQCNWITIEHTGQLRTTRILDRDAPNMKDGQCNVTVCATDSSGKTGTGKIVIKLIDENDNYPVITRKNYIMCKDKQPICVMAYDEDLPPYTVPFHFDIEKSVGSTWKITPHDDESALLSLVEDVNFGFYTVLLRVYDNGGNSGTNEITVHYCNCVLPSECSEPSTDIPVDLVPLDSPVGRTPSEEVYNASFGPWAILATTLGSLLLLSCLITPFGCWLHRKVPMTREVHEVQSFQNVIVSNTEAPDEEMTNLNILPVKAMNAAMSMSTVAEKKEGLEVTKGGGSRTELVKGARNHMAQSLWDFEQPLRNSCRDICSEWQNFTNPHLAEKVFLCEQDDEQKRIEEYVHSYTYEGKGSPVGSLSSCTGQSEEEELDFLNQQEPPFKTLVEVFVKK